MCGYQTTAHSLLASRATPRIPATPTLQQTTTPRQGNEGLQAEMLLPHKPSSTQLAGARARTSSSPSSTACPNTSPYRGFPASSTGGLPQPPGWKPNWAPGGIGALSPGTCAALLIRIPRGGMTLETTQLLHKRVIICSNMCYHGVMHLSPDSCKNM